MRNIQLSLETANRWYNGQDQELKDLAVQTYPELAKKELPKSWEELNLHINAFATKEQAEASIALAQLSQLLAVYNDGKTELTHYIRIKKGCNTIKIFSISGLTNFLSFKDYETAELFLKNFRSLILTAKPLL